MKIGQILEHKKGFRARKYNKKYIDPSKKSDTTIGPSVPAKKDNDLKEYKGGTDQERIDAFKKQAKDMRDKGFVRAADDTEKVAKNIYKKPQEKVKTKADEGRFGRNRDDQFSLGGRMPRTDRIDRDGPNDQDFSHKMKQQTINRLLDRHPEWERSDLELASLPELIQMLREAVKKPNATTRHLKDYPVSDKDVAKPVKPEKKKDEKKAVAEGFSYQTDSMVSHISQIITDIYPQGGDKNTYMKLVAQKMPRIVKNNPKLFRRAFGIAYDRFFHIDQDDDDGFDYTDYSMRQGERGMEESKEPKVPQKPRQGPLRPQTGAGRHQDKKKAMKQGKEKHKKPLAEAIVDSMLSELDKPSGKLYIVLKADMTGAVRMFGAFANSPEEVEFIAQRRGTKDKTGAKMKGLKVDLMFMDAADAMMDLKQIFKDIDFVGAEAAEFVFKKNILKNDEVDPRVKEEVRDFYEYVESGDDPRMALYKSVEVGTEPDAVGKGVDHFVVGPDGKRRRVSIPGKPSSQMGGHAVRQPDTFKYQLKQPGLANNLRSMGFNFDGNQIIMSEKQRSKLLDLFAEKGIDWNSVFGTKSVFKEQRSDYTKDEIVAVLTGQKTQAQVDAEAERTRGPDKGSQTTTAKPAPKAAQPKEATGDAVGKITKVDPTTKKATISKPDGSTQEIDSTALKPTSDGKMQMDAPDTDEIKTGTDVVSTEEDMMMPPNDSRSPIHGDEDHDEVSKLLVQRLRKLAGLQEQPAANQIPTDLTVAGMLDDPEVDPAIKPQLQQMIVARPDGTIDLAQTMRKASGEFYRAIPDLVEIFQTLAQHAADFVKTPEFAELGPADQNSIINLAKSLPATLQQMQAKMTQGAQFHDKEFNKMDAATGQYGDGQVQEADAGETAGQDIPPMPDISGLQPGQTKDLGNGQRVEIGRDGNIHYSGGFGTVVYSPQGKPLSYDTPTMGGLGMKQDLSTGDTTTSYNAGPLNYSQTKNAQGQTTSSKGTYSVGDGSFNVDQAYKDGQPTIQTRTGAGSQANVDLVKNQGALDRARQARPTAEDQQLEAMLRIAGLR